MQRLLFLSFLFISMLSSAQTIEQNELVEEFVQRFNRGNDDIRDFYYHSDNDTGKELKKLRDSLGRIENNSLLKKKGKTFHYQVTLENAGKAEMIFIFKGNLIDRFEFKTSEEHQIRSYTDYLFTLSVNNYLNAIISLDTDQAFKELDEIEKLYNSGNTSRGVDYKYNIKYSRAALHAISGNDKEALHLLKELKCINKRYIDQSLYDCSFASLHQNPEYMGMTDDPLSLFFATVAPLNDSLRLYANAHKPDDMLRFLQIKDSLYTALPSDLQSKVLYKRVADLLSMSAVYSMKNDVGKAIEILKEMKESGWDYAINSTVGNEFFTNLEQDLEYKKLTESECNCGEIFDWVVSEFEKSDAGFDYAVEEKGKKAYEDHTLEKRNESRSISSSNDCARHINDWLGFFRKTHIGFFMNLPAFADTVNLYDKFSIRRLSAETTYIKLKSFQGNKIRQSIARMIDANDYIISNTPNLIIDLRDNNGGSDDAWSPLCKYIDSKPYYIAGNMFRISEENARIMDQYGSSERAGFIRDNAGKRFAGKRELIYHKPDRDRIQKYPKSIVILINNNTASSGESLLRYARQSNKVKLMGQKSYGAEEVGNCVLIPSSDNQFLLFYGTTIHPWAKETQYLDYGLQPDIFLSSDLDWIDEAMKYLEYN